jgi:hypothetical protein
MTVAAGGVISTILKHDAKVTSYKLALLRAINDVVLSYPDVRAQGRAVAVPMRVLAEFWLAYYWPFANPRRPILQGPRSLRAGGRAHDMAFRPELEAFRGAWEAETRAAARPSDGFFVIHELRRGHQRQSYSPQLLERYAAAVRATAAAIHMPVRYAGPGQWTVFARPARYRDLAAAAVPLPGTRDADACLVVLADLWDGFRELSLWVEALCIHEWCLFVEGVNRDAGALVDRGDVYRLLTDRPDNRRPLTWERNGIDVLIMEGRTFVCPWTGRRIASTRDYDVDHLLPVAVYPTNELWNLVPADRRFNEHVKRDRLPSAERLAAAQPRLTVAYGHYAASKILAPTLADDVAARFSTVPAGLPDFPDRLTGAVVGFVEAVADARNLPRFA